MTIRGVIATVLLTILVLALGLFAYDYTYVRIGAARGAAAFEFLQKTIAEQEAKQKTQSPAPIAPPEVKK